MIDWIRAQLILFGLDQTNVRKSELASEEALVNVIEHGYKGLPGEIKIEVIGSEREIRIVIQDRGPAFNPLKQQVGFDPSATLDEREIGGLGILFMRQYMDDVLYSRNGDTNILTLIKHKPN